VGWFEKIFCGYNPTEYRDTTPLTDDPCSQKLVTVEFSLPDPHSPNDESPIGSESGKKFCEGQGLRYDQGKVRYDLVSPIALHYVALVWTMGTYKYAPRNWEKGLSFSGCFGCAMRHAWKWFRGEENDPESGLPHLAHAVWNLMVILHLSFTKPQFDDRVDLTEVPFPDMWEAPDANV
jgi:hypothetical protein